MKRLTPAEFCGSLVAATLIVTGVIWLLWPHEIRYNRPTNDRLGRPGSFTQVVGKTGSRVYGGIAVLLGVGIGAMALYRQKS